MNAAELKLDRAMQELKHDEANVALYRKSADPRLKATEARVVAMRAKIAKLAQSAKSTK